MLMVFGVSKKKRHRAFTKIPHLRACTAIRTTAGSAGFLQIMQRLAAKCRVS